MPELKTEGMTWDQLREIFMASQRIVMRLTEENNQLYAANRKLQKKLARYEEVDENEKPGYVSGAGESAAT